MPDGYFEPAIKVDRSQHLTALHKEWATPRDTVADAVGEVTGAPVLELRPIVAGEQNEVYEVTLERAPALIVKISHRGSAGLEREAWVLGQCVARGVPAPRVHTLRRVEVGGEQRSIIVMEKLPGERLCDISLGETDLRIVLAELGQWLSELHTIPAQGFGYLDGSGAGDLATVDDWLAASVTTPAPMFEEAGRSVGLESAMVRGWVREIVDSFQLAPPRAGLIHNDLLANHVLVHEGRLSGIIDFGEVAAEPLAIDFARWDFNEGERFPVEWIRAGYRSPATFNTPDEPTYQALWLATGLWLMQWYHKTGFKPGVEAARDRLLSRQRH